MNVEGLREYGGKSVKKGLESKEKNHVLEERGSRDGEVEKT